MNPMIYKPQNGKQYTPEEIAKLAQQKLFMDGGMGGSPNDLLSFGGIESDASFAESLDAQNLRQFNITMVNAAVATRTARLFSGYLTGNTTLAPGQATDGAFNDINGNAGLTLSSGQPGKTFAELVAFLEQTPTRLIGMKIESSLTAQLAQALVYERINPFQRDRSENIFPSNAQNQNTFQDKNVIIKLTKQVDDQMDLQYPFVASSTTSITFFFGVSANLSMFLEKQALRAYKAMGAVAPNDMAVLKSLGL